MRNIIFYITLMLNGSLRRHKTQKCQKHTSIYSSTLPCIRRNRSTKYEFDHKILKKRLEQFKPEQRNKIMFFSNMFTVPNTKFYLLSPDNFFGFEIACAILISNRKLKFITNDKVDEINHGIIIKPDNQKIKEDYNGYFNRIVNLIENNEKIITIYDFDFVIKSKFENKAYLNFEGKISKGTRIIKNSKKESAGNLKAQKFYEIVISNIELKYCFIEFLDMNKDKENKSGKE